MRALCGFGALLLLYLAVIPIGLIFSTLDSACAGPGCESSTLTRLVFTLIYTALAAALLGAAWSFAAYAARGDLRAQRRLPRALALTGIVVGLATFSLFFIAYPAGGAIALALAAATYLLVRIAGGRRDAGGRPGPSVNGYQAGGGANGDRALPGNRL